MSLKEVTRRQDHLINRSRSFTQGDLHSDQLEMDVVSVLGHGYQFTTKSGTLNKASYTLRRTPKLPKSPRPQRAQLLFEALRKGLREYVQSAAEDIESLKSNQDVGDSFTSTQIKLAERFRRRLEHRLCKVSELEDDYILHNQLREGVRTMAKAYVASPGNQRESLSHVKSGYKECTATMCAIEAQLENMLGTFQCKIKGMVGFARVCPGDVFEVTLKHGSQKWKSRGKIGKGQVQSWDNEINTLKALVGDVLNIKCCEVKTLGKSLVLGQKSCETKDLFAAQPQLMTVSVNTNGSLKFSIIVAWNPLDGHDESYVVYVPTRKRHEAAQLHKTNSLLRDDVILGRRPPSMAFSFSQDDCSEACSEAPSNGHAANCKLNNPRANHQTTNGSESSPLLNLRISEMRSFDHRTTGSHSLDHRMPLDRHRELEDSKKSDSMDSLTSLSGRVIDNADLVPYSVTCGATRPYALENGSRDSRSQSRDPSSPSRDSPDGGRLPRYGVLCAPALPAHESLSHWSATVPSPAPLPERCHHATLHEAMTSLAGVVEDIQGQYPELQHLEEQVVFLQDLIKKNSGSLSSHSSDMSISIESALEAFDFLNTEDAGLDDYAKGIRDVETPTMPRKKQISYNRLQDVLISPESSTRTADSGISESITQHHENNGDTDQDWNSGVGGEDPVVATTRNIAVDRCLIFHLSYTEWLLGHLGNFGPTKCREIYALEKLRMQACILEDLATIAKQTKQITNVNQVVISLDDNLEARQLWGRCLPGADAPCLYMSAATLLTQLERIYYSAVQEKYDVQTRRVFRHLVTRILDLPETSLDEIADVTANKDETNDVTNNMAADTIVTMHQYLAYFSDKDRRDVRGHVEDLAAEMWIIDRLRSGDTDIVIKTILTFRKSLPPTECLKVLALLLVLEASELRETADSYLRNITSNRVQRSKAIVIFVETLEDMTSELRCAACHALKILKSREAMEQLLYVAETDSSSLVQAAARDALQSFGEDASKALQEAQLTSHGFQGLNVVNRSR